MLKKLKNFKFDRNKFINEILKTFKNEKAKYWSNYKLERIYFKLNNSIIDLEVSYYGTGNISHALLKGEKINNVRAMKLQKILKNAIIFYNVITSRISVQNLPSTLEPDLEKEIKNYFYKKISSVQKECIEKKIHHPYEGNQK